MEAGAAYTAASSWTSKCGHQVAGRPLRMCRFGVRAGWGMIMGLGRRLVRKTVRKATPVAGGQGHAPGADR
jgi:hypothetical protein